MPVPLPNTAASSRERSSSSSGVPLNRALVPAGRVSLPKDNGRAVVPRANFQPATRNVAVAPRNVGIQRTGGPLTIPRFQRREERGTGTGYRVPRFTQTPRSSQSPLRVAQELKNRVAHSMHEQAKTAEGMAAKLRAEQEMRASQSSGLKTEANAGKVARGAIGALVGLAKLMGMSFAAFASLGGMLGNTEGEVTFVDANEPSAEGVAVAASETVSVPARVRFKQRSSARPASMVHVPEKAAPSVETAASVSEEPVATYDPVQQQLAYLVALIEYLENLRTRQADTALMNIQRLFLETRQQLLLAQRSIDGSEVLGGVKQKVGEILEALPLRQREWVFAEVRRFEEGLKVVPDQLEEPRVIDVQARPVRTDLIGTKVKGATPRPSNPRWLGPFAGLVSVHLGEEARRQLSDQRWFGTLAELVPLSGRDLGGRQRSATVASSNGRSRVSGSRLALAGSAGTSSASSRSGGSAGLSK